MQRHIKSLVPSMWWGVVTCGSKLSSSILGAWFASVVSIVVAALFLVSRPGGGGGKHEQKSWRPLRQEELAWQVAGRSLSHLTWQACQEGGQLMMQVAGDHVCHLGNRWLVQTAGASRIRRQRRSRVGTQQTQVSVFSASDERGLQGWGGKEKSRK